MTRMTVPHPKGVVMPDSDLVPVDEGRLERSEVTVTLVEPA